MKKQETIVSLDTKKSEIQPKQGLHIIQSRNSYNVPDQYIRWAHEVGET